MKGDYSRDTFDPAKHFTRVLMQQGRVQLDSDWNEQGAILLHYLQTLAADLIGPYGGPLDQLGFKIKPMSPDNDESTLSDLSIGFGRYYVDGILCENYEQSPNVIRPQKRTASEIHNVSESGGAVRNEAGDTSQTTYRGQWDYPPDPLREDPKKELPVPLFVFLDVWERHITAFEDDQIREVALGGPDTAARAKVVWQVRIIPIGDDKQIKRDVLQLGCKEFENNTGWNNLKKELQPENRGRLRARAFVPENSDDVCIVSPESRYRGAENQLYRVEIHKSGTAAQGGPTFKWSRENGSTIFPIQSVSEKIVTLESMGRDERFGLEVGDWVEVVDDDYTLLGKADPLLRVEIVDPLLSTITLSGAPASQVGRDPKKHPLIRRWDQRSGDAKTGGLTLTDGAANIIEPTTNNSHWLNLEDGVQVQFGRGGNYRRGDFWLIPARTATGDVEWPGPTDNPRPMPPRGVEHHYAPLAIIMRANDNDDPHLSAIDLRHQIEPLSTCVCPQIEVVNEANFEANQEISFVARVASTDPALSYSWNVSVSRGTGSVPVTSPDSLHKKVTVKPGPGVEEITAEVTVDRLPAGCLKVATGKSVRRAS
jgi:hypothetical protein